jgi:hypothetical protein
MSVPLLNFGALEMKNYDSENVRLLTEGFLCGNDNQMTRVIKGSGE